MTEFMQVKTQDLTGAALDWAVAKVDGIEYRHAGIKCRTRLTGRTFHHYTKPNFMPSTDWSQGGPLIEKHLIELGAPTAEGTFAGVWYASWEWGPPSGFFGSTPLIAACRAIVASALGDTVSVPKELV